MKQDESQRTASLKRVVAMSRGLQVAVLSLSLSTQFAAQSLSIDAIPNKSPADVLNLLGQPTARTQEPNTTREAWRYDTPAGFLWVFLIADRAVLRPLDPSNMYRATDYPSDTRQLLKRSRAAMAAGNVAEAAAILDYCAGLKNWGRRCVADQRKLRERILTDTDSKLGGIPSGDLHAKRTLLLQALRDYPDAPGLTATRAGIEAEIDRSNLAAFQWILDERRTKALAVDVGAARGLIEAANYPAALKRLSGWGSDPEATSLATDAKERLRERTLERVTRPAAPRNLVQLEEAAVAVEEAAPYAAANELRQWRGALGVEATEAIGKTMGLPLKGTVGLSRLAYRALTKTAPILAAMSPLDSETFPGGAVPPRMSLEISAEPGCGFGAQLRALADEVHAGSPSDVMWTTPGQADVALNLQFRCTVQTEDAKLAAAPSTYVMTYQQITNPEYVRLQTELEAAQARLRDIKTKNILNPPVGGWAGAFAGAAEGLAAGTVNTILAQLRDTPPFLRQPVEAAYSAQTVSVTRQAEVVAAMTVRAGSPVFTDAAEESANTEVTAKGIHGVLPGDRTGLVNREPTLPPAEELYAKALPNAHMAAIAGLKQLAERAWIARARHAYAAKLEQESLGLLLIAADFDAQPSELGVFETALEAGRGTSLENLAALRVDLSALKAAAVEKASSTRAVPPIAGRAGMLQRVLSSVVTVETDKATGSGFFVSATGHLITNAHVIEGATRIRVKTRDKEVFLASVITTSTKHDLALLGVRGLTSQPIPMGDSSSVETGVDVVAVGSPLGLQGTATRGIVSARRRLAGVAYLQIDAAISPGNSGGPLLTEDGAVVGVNTWKVGGTDAESLGFAIEINEAKTLFGALLK